MSLLEDMKKALDEQGAYGASDEAAAEVGATQVDYEILDRTRWGVIVQDIFKRDDELVAVVYESASGDESGEFYPDVYSVVAENATVIKYTKVD